MGVGRNASPERKALCPCSHGKHRRSTVEARRKNWILGRFEVKDNPPVPKGLFTPAGTCQGEGARSLQAEPIYSVRVTVDYRALGLREDNTMIRFWIGSHADYDELISRL
jgi:hypothetical protein